MRVVRSIWRRRSNAAAMSMGRRVLTIVAIVLIGFALVNCDSDSDSPSALRQADRSGPLPVSGESVVPPDAEDGITPGGLTGSSAVTSDGVAHYTIPLWVPPGRLGMEPDLALEYN